MSRVLNEDAPYSDEDKAYLHDRSLDWKIEVNDRLFGNTTRYSNLPTPQIAGFDQTVGGEWEDHSSSPTPREKKTVDEAPGADTSLSPADPTPEALHVPVPVDFSAYDKTLVHEIQALNDSDLKDELAARKIPAIGSKEEQQFWLIKAVSEQGTT